MTAHTKRSEERDPYLTRNAKLQAAADGEPLADRRTFVLNATQWKTFMAARYAPPRPLHRLERLLKEPGFFDAGTN